MNRKIKLYKNKKWIEINSIFDWKSENFQNKDLIECLVFLGYNKLPFITFGFDDIPDFELFELRWKKDRNLEGDFRKQDNPYKYYGFLSVNGCSDIEEMVFENQIDVLEFLKEYASVFDLLRRNLLDQIHWDKEM